MSFTRRVPVLALAVLAVAMVAAAMSVQQAREKLSVASSQLLGSMPTVSDLDFLSGFVTRLTQDLFSFVTDVKISECEAARARAALAATAFGGATSAMVGARRLVSVARVALSSAENAVSVFSAQVNPVLADLQRLSENVELLRSDIAGDFGDELPQVSCTTDAQCSRYDEPAVHTQVCRTPNCKILCIMDERHCGLYDPRPTNATELTPRPAVSVSAAERRAAMSIRIAKHAAALTSVGVFNADSSLSFDLVMLWVVEIVQTALQEAIKDVIAVQARLLEALKKAREELATAEKEYDIAADAVTAAERALAAAEAAESETCGPVVGAQTVIDASLAALQSVVNAAQQGAGAIRTKIWPDPVKTTADVWFTVDCGPRPQFCSEYRSEFEVAWFADPEHAPCVPGESFVPVCRNGACQCS